MLVPHSSKLTCLLPPLLLLILLTVTGPVTPRPTLLATSGGSIVVAQTFTKDAGSNSDHSTPKPASYLPSPSNVEVLTVNASAVSIQWYFDCSEDVLIQLPDNLSFELSVKKSGKEAITFANVSGCCNQHEYSYIYKEIDSQTPYTFGVTAVYGTAKSKTSYFDYYLGWGPLGPPPDLNVTKVDSFSITLQWSPSPYSHSAPPSIYFLYYGLSPDEMNKRALSSDLSHVVVRLIPNTTYYFCVRASGIQETVCSKVVSATTNPVYLPKLVFSQESGFRSVKVVWDEPSVGEYLTVKEYNIYLTADGTSSHHTTNHMFTVNNMVPDHEYLVQISYTVVMVIGGSWSKESPLNNFIVTVEPDAQIFNINCSSCKPLSPSSVEINWKVMPEADNKEFEDFKTNIYDSFSKRYSTQVTLSQNSLKISGLHAWSEHHFILEVEDSRGYKSNNSSCPICWTLEDAPLAPPTNVTVRAVNQETVITWQEVPPKKQNGRLEYKVQVFKCLEDQSCLKCSQGIEVLENYTTDNSITIFNLLPITNYSVTVGGWTGNQTLEGPSSPPTCFTTADGVPDSAPRIIQSNLILGQAVCIHWSDIQDFHLHGNHKYYQVTAKYKPRNSSTIQVNVTNVTSVTYLWGNLDGNTVYNFTVQACTDSACGPSSDIVNIKPSELTESSNFDFQTATMTSDACSDISTKWNAIPVNLCGTYSFTVEYFQNTTEPVEQKHKVPQGATELTINTKSLSSGATYLFQLNVIFAGKDLDQLESSSNYTELYIPLCTQDQLALYIGIVIGAFLLLVFIIIMITILSCCVYIKRQKCAPRSLLDTPHMYQRIGLTPYQGQSLSNHSHFDTLSDFSSDDDPLLPSSPCLSTSSLLDDSPSTSLSRKRIHPQVYTSSSEKDNLSTLLTHSSTINPSLPYPALLSHPLPSKALVPEGRRHRPEGQSDNTIYGTSSSNSEDEEYDSALTSDSESFQYS